MSTVDSIDELKEELRLAILARDSAEKERDDSMNKCHQNCINLKAWANVLEAVLEQYAEQDIGGSARAILRKKKDYVIE